MIKRLPVEIEAILENEDISLSIDKNADGEYYAEMEFESPAGEDVVFGYYYDGTAQGFIKGFQEYAKSFDSDSHAESWIKERGKNGVPSTIRALIDDAEAIKEELQTVTSLLTDL